MADRIPLSRNMISYLGWSITAISFAIGLVLLIADLFYGSTPYNALVTYMIIPIFIGGGISLGVLGLIIEHFRRKRRKPEHAFPVVDMNRPGTRRNLVVFLGLVALFFGISSVATYRAFVYTESVEFCGQVCHEIMTPEFTAYQVSPHARVKCVECHIGEGAEWYARSKVSGLRQVYRTLLDTYELPIEVPIRDLRPARETCEHCHWPEKFTGTIEVVNWHFWRDEENTPSRYHILMKVGGAIRETGEFTGIHWHTSAGDIVRYWPRDRERLDIPWVEVTYANGEVKTFLGDDPPDGRPPEDEIRVMDCIDCHNRPSHIYKPPEEMINAAMSAGTLDTGLPALKQVALDLLQTEYENSEAAFAAIEEGIAGEYGEDFDAQTIEQTQHQLVEMYNKSHFPEQKIDWTTYPNHIGHRHFPGCFRCHNDEHATEDGEVISMDCHMCHEFVVQDHGEDVLGEVTYNQQDYQHPGGMEDIWEGSLCTDCHAPGAM